jgi:organic radical activating enzyme
MDMNKNTFCSFPFETIFLGADSGVKTCCSARGDIGNLNTSPIIDILQGSQAQSVRESILNNQWHPQCSQCKEIEDMGGRSERSTILEKKWNTYQEIKLDKEYFNLKMIDLRWSNTCNLACNYCYEYFSSQWSTIKGIKVNTLNETNEESLFLFIEKHKETIESINLLGGEPFLQKQNLKLVDILKDKNYYVLTNFAVPLENNKIAIRLLEEPNAAWGISFETVGKRYEYVRHNASWDQFNKNIEFVKRKKPGFKANVHPLYCTYSAFNLVEFYDYILNENFFLDTYWCVIQNIDGLNVMKLPKHLQERAIKEIENCEKKFAGEPSLIHLQDIKNSLIKSIDTKHEVSKTFNSFTTEIEKQLVNKEFNFKELWPDIAKDLDL